MIVSSKTGTNEITRQYKYQWWTPKKNMCTYSFRSTNKATQKYSCATLKL